jgi:hypothetical protein
VIHWFQGGFTLGIQNLYQQLKINISQLGRICQEQLWPYKTQNNKL